MGTICQGAVTAPLLVVALAAAVPVRGDEAVDAVREAARRTAQTGFAYSVDGRYRRTGEYLPPDVLSAGIQGYRSVRRGRALLIKGPDGLWKAPEERPGESDGTRNPRTAAILKALAEAEMPTAWIDEILGCVAQGTREPDETKDGATYRVYLLGLIREKIQEDFEGQIWKQCEEGLLHRPQQIYWATLKGTLRVWVTPEGCVARVLDQRTVKVVCRPEDEPRERTFRNRVDIVLSGFGRTEIDLPVGVRERLALGRKGNHVVLDADHVLEINGRKCFPIGFTLGPPPDGRTPDGREAFDELHAVGASFLRTGPWGEGRGWDDAGFERERLWLDAAARHGLYTWTYLDEAAGAPEGDAEREALLKKVVAEFKDHPGLGAWKGADEPAWGKQPVEPLVRTHRLLRELDPDHPLVIIHAPRGTNDDLRPYNAACDIVGTDIYPIGYPAGHHSDRPNQDISMVGDFTRSMAELAEDRLGVWMTLQIAWSGVLHEGKTLRMPTFPEERFMAYHAVVHGARGLMFFGGHATKALSPEDEKLGWNWTFWRRVLRPVVEELGENSPLRPALVAPDSALPVKGTDGIDFRVREACGFIYLIACRRVEGTATAGFEGLPANVEEGEVLFEPPRKVKAKDGKFKDWFGPFEVHVYRFRK